MSKKLFLIIGAPGSGKTTDAEIIAKNNDNITHYSTGDMFRAEAASGSEIGKIIESCISKGLIVPISIAVETIVGAIKTATTDIVIIDGYPRSIEQMDELDSYLLSENNVKLKGVIEVKVSEKTARERVLGRARGVDDNNEVFNNRMKIYIEPLSAIQSSYKTRNLLNIVDGEKSIEEIVVDIQSVINSKI